MSAKPSGQILRIQKRLAMLGALQIFVAIGIGCATAIAYFSTNYSPDQLREGTSSTYAEVYAIYRSLMFGGFPIIAIFLLSMGYAVLRERHYLQEHTEQRGAGKSPG